MKINIGPYKNWFGPYQLAELLCFWAKPEVDEYGYRSKPRWVHNFGEWLAHGSVEPEPTVGDILSFDRKRHNTLLYRFLLWLDGKKKRRVKVRIDRWDTWSMDHTLALVILPMLRQLKETKHGAPFVDDEDVPEHLRSTAAKPLTQEQKDTGHVDEYHEARWDSVLDAMIFSFESKLDDSWEEQFHTGEYDFQTKVIDENGTSELIRGPNHTATVDWEGRKAYEQRIQKGFMLFGKYYQALWD